MADQRSSIDVTTLAEVQRLLASTEFASIDDIVRHSGVIDLGDVERTGPTRPARGAPVVAADSGGPTPLPRRR